MRIGNNLKRCYPLTVIFLTRYQSSKSSNIENIQLLHRRFDGCLYVVNND